MNLTKSERRVLLKLAEGLTVKEIARALFVAPSTVVSHKKNIYRKTEARSLVQLGVIAVRTGLVSMTMILLTVTGMSQVVLEPFGPNNVGTVQTMGPNGNLNVALTSRAAPEDNHGALAIFNPAGAIKVLGDVGANGEGRLMTMGPNGNFNFLIDGLEGNPNHGSLKLFDAAGNVKVRAYVNAQGQGIVEADIFQEPPVNSLKSAHRAQYSMVRSAEPSVMLVGTSSLVDGQARVHLPKHFSKLIESKGMTVLITPLSASSRGIAVLEKDRTGFIVKELYNGTGHYAFDWELKAKRRDSIQKQSINQTDENTSRPPVANDLILATQKNGK